MSILAEFWDDKYIEKDILTFNTKQTFTTISTNDAKALTLLLTDKCGCLMKRNLVIPDEDALYEIDEIINSEVIELCNEYMTMKQSLDYDEQGKSHAQSTFKPYAMDRKIDSDLLSFTPQLSAQQAINLMRDQSQAITRIFKQLERITQKIVYN